jgi:hypothetical protein
VALRERSLARDPQNARSSLLLAGNLAERGMSLAAAGRLNDALRDVQRALQMETAIAEVDPKGTATRFAMADFQTKLASVHAMLAKSKGSGPALQHWREAAKYFRRADALYTALDGEGSLQSPQLRANAKLAADGAREASEKLARD